MKLGHLGAVATAAVIAVGVVMAAGPAYMHTVNYYRAPPVMLSFSVINGSNAPEWCNELASVLAEHKVKAAVFVTGQVAEQHPECVRSFASQGIDVGSQTYGYVNLTSVDDYLDALEEVRQGKSAVDKAGKIDSRLFRAPYGETDQNIYSLLSSSNITADFSYDNQYNKFEGGQFIRYDLVTCDCDNLSPDAVTRLLEAGQPVMVEFGNSVPVSNINGFITALKSDDRVRFVSASELVGQDLTVMGVST
ncbi:MAG TPA: polysaccharide deacetylase family protein [Nitrososphaera sp.]